MGIAQISTQGLRIFFPDEFENRVHGFAPKFQGWTDDGAASLAFGTSHRHTGSDRYMRRWLPTVLLLMFAGTVFWLERARPLRRRVDPGPQRIGRNLAMAGITASILHCAERPLTRPLTQLVEHRRIGLVHALRLPAGVAPWVAVVLFDYTLYLWHILLQFHMTPLGSSMQIKVNTCVDMQQILKFN